MTFDASVFGAIVQYPDAGGAVHDLRADRSRRAHEAGALVSVGADLLSLALLVPPGEMGADVVYGSAQRFGVPHGIRRSACGVLRHAPCLRSAAAGPADRRVGRRSRPPRVSHGARDARAAHPAREGHVEHLHRPGAPGQYGGDVCRLSRTERDHGDRVTRPHAGQSARGGARGARHRAAQRALLRHVAGASSRRCRAGVGVVRRPRA